MPRWRPPPVTIDPYQWTSAALEPQTNGDDKGEQRETASPKRPHTPLTTPVLSADRWDTTPETAPLDDSGPTQTSSTSTREPSMKKQRSTRKKLRRKGKSMPFVKR